jgi:2-polyprenyl-3-methyl-5-hydroxy-6-metoxy-1,4-benzoquinol methylase
MRFLHRLQPVRIVHREKFLVEAAQGKRTMHLGCVDSGLLETRLEKDDLLHARLARSSSDLWGMDLDAAGIERLRSLGYRNLIVGSAEEPPPNVPRGAFDVIIAGELIEHVLNVGRFLRESAELLRPGGQFIITTPNAFRFTNRLPLFFGFELVHPDHVAWFSPITLRRAAEMAGLSVKALFVYSGGANVRLENTSNPAEWLGRALYNGFMWIAHPVATRLFPYLADGLVLVAERSSSDQTVSQRLPD